jgi:hypothetical protein
VGLLSIGGVNIMTVFVQFVGVLGQRELQDEDASWFMEDFKEYLKSGVVAQSRPYHIKYGKANAASVVNFANVAYTEER